MCRECEGDCTGKAQGTFSERVGKREGMDGDQMWYGMGTVGE